MFSSLTIEGVKQGIEKNLLGWKLPKAENTTQYLGRAVVVLSIVAGVALAICGIFKLISSYFNNPRELATQPRLLDLSTARTPPNRMSCNEAEKLSIRSRSKASKVEAVQ